jgi:hypothetical protein
MYANGRVRLDNADWTITTNTGGNLSSGIYYFSICAYNRIGRNYNIISSPISILDGDSITFTINSTAENTGEYWTSYVIGISNTTALESFNQICRIPNTGVYPLEVIINDDILLTTEAILDAPANVTLYTHGMLRGFASTGFIYEYDELDTTTLVDGFNVLLSDNGYRWKIRGGWSIYLSDVYAVDGCRYDISSNTVDSSYYSTYSGDGSNSEEIHLWLSGSDLIIKGTRISASVFVDAINKSSLFSGKLYLTFKGYVHLDTGELQTTLNDDSFIFNYLDTEVMYNSEETELYLEDDLDVNKAYYVVVRLSFNSYEILRYIPSESLISILLYFSEENGVFNESGEILGNIMLSTGDYMRVLPSQGYSCIVQSGSGLIQSYSFPLQGEQTLYGLEDSSLNKIAINRDGTAYATTVDSLSPSSALRAVVGTLPGESSLSTSKNVNVASSLNKLQITINYPTKVRTDYPDVIANSLCTFAVKSINIYIVRNSDSEIRRYTLPINNTLSSEVFEITDYNIGTVITSLPTNTDVYFNLYEVKNITTVSSVSGGTNFTTGTHSVYYSFLYEGDTITSIRHLPEYLKTFEDNICYELKYSLIESLDNMAYFIAPIHESILTSIPSTTLYDGTESKIIYSDNSKEEIVYDAYNTSSGNNTTTWKPSNLASGEGGLWVIKTYTFNQNIRDEITAEIATVNNRITNEVMTAIENTSLEYAIVFGG